MDINALCKLIERAEALLNNWLVDNTEEVFEEAPEIDDARSLLNDALQLIQDADENRRVDFLAEQYLPD